MDLASRLDQFREDNPYDTHTQAKRLLASGDQDLILHVLALGFATARQRQRHTERQIIKNTGAAPPVPKERLVPRPGGSTGSVKVVKIPPSRQMANAFKQLIYDVWRINGEQKLGDATANDLSIAIDRENASSTGHAKNAAFYSSLKEPMNAAEKVRDKWAEKEIRAEIEKVYGEFRKKEAA